MQSYDFLIMRDIVVPWSQIISKISSVKIRYRMRNKDATHIQGLQTVPAEGMLAVLAHHLCTALVPLNVNFTFRTALDWCIILFVLIKRAEEKRRK